MSDRVGNVGRERADHGPAADRRPGRRRARVAGALAGSLRRRGAGRGGRVGPPAGAAVPPEPRRAPDGARARRAHGGRVAELLGVADAREYSGFTSFDGAVFLGPSATRGLQLLVDARHRVRVGVGETISRADVDRMTMALAVLLHETLHATGPSAADDVASTRSGRAFEEGFTEAATLDLLRPFVARLDVPAPLRARLAAAVARYRTGYAARWRGRGGCPPARRGRRRARDGRAPGGSRVADTWGPQRWTRLAVATGTAEDELRAGAPG